MATAPAPFPADSNATGGGAVPSFPPGAPSPNAPSASSPFSGGLPALMKLMKQLEGACQGLAQLYPSLAPLAANTISNFRMAIPSAVSTDAGSGQSQPNPGVNGIPSGMSSSPGGGGSPSGLPSPPSQ